ncbi:MAG: hypothetical protein BJ554DRAFT_7791 [Olpidium bornovanus]|uniref:Uncharacterized protein n=1 Tax=Olpidium bornovanus TaxID=278681 RepID=A0A8H8DJJ6_9FUNG|nr:MAG: hypothetical protein BJ554DRAFT_7791 [Olpidium bornovanus]
MSDTTEGIVLLLSPSPSPARTLPCCLPTQNHSACAKVFRWCVLWQAGRVVGCGAVFAIFRPRTPKKKKNQKKTAHRRPVCPNTEDRTVTCKLL